MAKETKLPNIDVHRLVNGKGYSLTFDGMKQPQGYMYYSPDKLLHGFMAHIGLHMTDQLNMENIEDFLIAATNWNEEEKNVKEIERLNSTIRLMNTSRVSLIKRLMAERSRFVGLVESIKRLTVEFKASKEVQDRLNATIKNCTKVRCYTLKDFGITSDLIKDAEEAEQTDEDADDV